MAITVQGVTSSAEAGVGAQVVGAVVIADVRAKYTLIDICRTTRTARKEENSRINLDKS